MASKESDHVVSSGALVWAAIREPSGVAVGFAGLTLSLATIFFTPAAMVPLQWTLAIAVMISAYITVCHSVIRSKIIESNKLNQLLESSQVRTPKVLRAIKSPQNESDTILLVEGNALFGTSMIVSIYHENAEGFEMLIATGIVQTAQSNGLLQISVTDWLSPFDQIKESLRAGAEEPLGRLIIRPSATTNFSPQPRYDLSEAFSILLSRLPREATIENGSNDDD